MRGQRASVGGEAASFVIVAGILLFPNLSLAQERVEPGGGQSQVIDIIAHRVTDKGRVTHCEIEYRVGFEDFTYRQGAASLLVGSIGVMAPPGKVPAYLFKVQGHDLVGEKFVPFEIPYAYPSAGDKSLAGKEFTTFVCERGGFCAAYPFLDSIDFFDALQSNTWHVSFQRAGGHTDVDVPVAHLIDQKSSAQYQKFAECMLELINTLKTQ